MRISDWSSDVCSSDLSANISALSASASMLLPESSACLAFLRPSKLFQTVFQSPRVAPLLYSVARVSKKFACSTPLRSGASQGSGRSEEHTSELQSLMRNSYAVFCLKKKNK